MRKVDGLDFAEEFGPLAFIMRARAEGADDHFEPALVLGGAGLFVLEAAGGHGGCADAHAAGHHRLFNEHVHARAQSGFHLRIMKRVRCNKHDRISRLLLEQDNMGIPRIDKVILAGECQKIAFDEFLREQLPDVEVKYLRTPEVDTSALPADLQEAIPEYAVAISTAWKMLDEKHPAFFPVNVLPESVREGQRSFKLAWHGYVLFVLVFLSTFYFTTRYTGLKQELGQKEGTLALLQEKVSENDKLKAAIGALNDQIGRYNTALAVYDSLVPGSDMWNRSLAHLSKGVEDLGAIWITEMRSMGGGSISLQGYALYRARIPRIAALFDNATLTKVEVKEIRVNSPPVYNFTITVPPQVTKADSAATPVGTPQ